jgi:hypothetical protein
MTRRLIVGLFLVILSLTSITGICNAATYHSNIYGKEAASLQLYSSIHITLWDNETFDIPFLANIAYKKIREDGLKRNYDTTIWVEDTDEALIGNGVVEHNWLILEDRGQLTHAEVMERIEESIGKNPDYLDP